MAAKCLYKVLHNRRTRKLNCARKTEETIMKKKKKQSKTPNTTDYEHWALSIVNHEQENKRLYIFIISNGFIYSSICVLLLCCGCHHRIYFRLCMLYAFVTHKTPLSSLVSNLFFFFFFASSHSLLFPLLFRSILFVQQSAFSILCHHFSRFAALSQS